MIGRCETYSSATPDFSSEPRFVADVMLGRLARWLRFLGFDTVYSPSMTDGALIRIAREEGRIILTRDTRLVKIKGLGRFLLISSNEVLDQLHETIRAFELVRFDHFSRCVACNGALRIIEDKSVVKDSVPEYVFLHHDVFWECEECGKIYWEGSHPQKFREVVRDILENVDKEGSK